MRRGRGVPRDRRAQRPPRARLVCAEPLAVAHRRRGRRASHRPDRRPCLIAFTTATAIASRHRRRRRSPRTRSRGSCGTSSRLSLDAIAIAGQAIVGRYLGASDERAYPRQRAPDARVGRHRRRRDRAGGARSPNRCSRARSRTIPPSAISSTRSSSRSRSCSRSRRVFVLDGILIGAGDVRYLARAMAAATAVFLPAALLVLWAHASSARALGRALRLHARPFVRDGPPVPRRRLAGDRVRPNLITKLGQRCRSGLHRRV